LGSQLANVLNKLPKCVQPEAKRLLQEIMMAPDKQSAELSKKIFEETFAAKYDKSTTCLLKNWGKLTLVFNYPAQHWTSIRKTNPMESAFAAVKLRTKSTKGSGCPRMAATLAFKLLQEAEKKWRKISGSEEIKNLLQGIEYLDGVMVATESVNQEVAAG